MARESICFPSRGVLLRWFVSPGGSKAGIQQDGVVVVQRGKGSTFSSGLTSLLFVLKYF